MHILELQLGEGFRQRVGCRLELGEQSFFGNELPLERRTRNLLEDPHDFQRAEVLRPSHFQDLVACARSQVRAHRELRDVSIGHPGDQRPPVSEENHLPLDIIEAERRAQPDLHEVVARQNGEAHSAICQRALRLRLAWDDRAGAAKELHDLLESRGVSVWFSEKDVALGTPLLREIDKGLAKSRVGIVLVTPALLRRLQGESIADKELSVLLARDQLVPIVHGTTYEALREVSPLLGSRTGLSTAENPMADVAAKLAELVAL
jgi:hypothetical protein